MMRVRCRNDNIGSRVIACGLQREREPVPLDQKGIQRALQVKLGEALRSQYELARPLSDQLDALLKELERRASDGGAPKSGEC